MKKKVALALIATAVAGLSLTALTSVGAARDVRGALACGNPKTTPLGEIFGANRGTTFCNDGASAKVIIKGKPKPPFLGGVCWRNKTNVKMIGVGSLVINGRKTSDPKGLLVTDEPPGDRIGDTLDLSMGLYHWTGPVKVKWTSKTSGTFAATSIAVTVNGQLTGSFHCKRVLYAPEQ